MLGGRFIPILAAYRGFRVAEIPVNHRARQHGRSRYGPERYLRGFLDLVTHPEHLLVEVIDLAVLDLEVAPDGAAQPASLGPALELGVADGVSEREGLVGADVAVFLAHIPYSLLLFTGVWRSAARAKSQSRPSWVTIPSISGLSSTYLVRLTLSDGSKVPVSRRYPEAVAALRRGARIG